jgi:SH3-like domain-containing protein
LSPVTISGGKIWVSAQSATGHISSGKNLADIDNWIAGKAEKYKSIDNLDSCRQGNREQCPAQSVKAGVRREVARIGKCNRRWTQMDADQVSGWSVPLQTVVWASRPKESAATGGYTNTHQKRDDPIQRKKTTDFTDSTD